jgi:hypothetical protein
MFNSLSGNRILEETGEYNTSQSFNAKLRTTAERKLVSKLPESAEGQFFESQDHGGRT